MKRQYSGFENGLGTMLHSYGRHVLGIRGPRAAMQAIQRAKSEARYATVALDSFSTLSGYTE